MLPASPSATLPPLALSVGRAGRLRLPSTRRDMPPSTASWAGSTATELSFRATTAAPFSASAFAGTLTPSSSKSSACTRYRKSRRFSFDVPNSARRVAAPTVSSMYGAPPDTSTSTCWSNATRTRTTSPA